MVVSFTPLQLKLGIALGNLSLVCGCSAMETHFMKLSMNSACAYVASIVWNLVMVLQPTTDDFSSLCASALGSPVMCACVAHHFVAELVLLLDISTSQEQHLQLTKAPLAR